MAYYVYILVSNVSGNLYKGFTNDLSRRLKEHNAGYNKSTKSGRPWELIYSEKCNNRLEAREREKFFKSGVGREFIKINIWPRSITE
ncbi:MAG: GIY-YIG nuclease family protein [Fulvivirga sp.]|uniref:GIY-YIG nuclease family protein n=1 Tax=Fulvivirga sp. TaxID=1931237 RepID=UPI0032ECF171